jgi:hypothetical protein
MDGHFDTQLEAVREQLACSGERGGGVGWGPSQPPVAKSGRFRARAVETPQPLALVEFSGVEPVVMLATLEALLTGAAVEPVVDENADAQVGSHRWAMVFRLRREPFDAIAATEVDVYVRWQSRGPRRRSSSEKGTPTRSQSASFASRAWRGTPKRVASISTDGSRAERVVAVAAPLLEEPAPAEEPRSGTGRQPLPLRLGVETRPLKSLVTAARAHKRHDFDPRTSRRRSALEVRRTATAPEP